MAGAVIVADQLTKSWVLDHVRPGPHHLLGPLGMRVGRNTGVGFSLIAGHSWLAFWVSLVLLVVVASLAVRSVPVASSVVLGLLLGGGVSNEVDRLTRGRTGVVDFLTLPHWPTFNLADTAITVGVVGLAALLALRRPILAPRAEP